MTGTVYATRTDLTTLGLPPAALTPVTTSDQDAMLAYASGLVDSYIGNRFRLPITTWGMDITKATVEIASYLIMKRRGWNPGAADAEQIKLAYDETMNWLVSVRDGVATPYGITQAAVNAASPSDTGQDAAFVLQPLVGSMGNARDFFHHDSDECLTVGAPVKPRLRGY